MSKFNIMLGVPAYGGNVHTDFVHSLLGIESARDHELLEYSLMTISNESLITRARNTIISAFYHNKQFTHLFFIDSDLGFPEKTLPLLLKQNKDVIGVPVPLKGTDDKGNSVLNVGKQLSEMDENGVCEVEHIGNALLMLNRKAAETLCNNSDIYKPSSLTRGDRQSNEQFDVFQVGVKDGVYLSEDYFICHKLRDLGFKINVLNGIPVRHNGNYVFSS